MIPAGGSNEIGTWGYIEAFRELMEQVRREREMLLLVAIRFTDTRRSQFQWA